jgi:hypothetical protein
MKYNIIQYNTTMDKEYWEFFGPINTTATVLLSNVSGPKPEVTGPMPKVLVPSTRLLVLCARDSIPVLRSLVLSLK